MRIGDTVETPLGLGIIEEKMIRFGVLSYFIRFPQKTNFTRSSGKDWFDENEVELA